MSELEQALAQLDAVAEELRRFSEWTGISIGILVGLIALVWFYPPARSFAIRVGVFTLVIYFALVTGNHLGRADVTAEWNAAKAAAAAAAKQRDVDAQAALDAKYGPIAAQLDQASKERDAYEQQLLAAMAKDASGACPLVPAALQLRNHK